MSHCTVLSFHSCKTRQESLLHVVHLKLNLACRGSYYLAHWPSFFSANLFVLVFSPFMCWKKCNSEKNKKKYAFTESVYKRIKVQSDKSNIFGCLNLLDFVDKQIWKHPLTVAILQYNKWKGVVDCREQGCTKYVFLAGLRLKNPKLAAQVRFP